MDYDANDNLKNNLNKDGEHYLLKMYVCNDDVNNYETLKEWYLNAILKHNKNIETSLYPDAGFDLFVPDEYFAKDVGGAYGDIPLLKVDMKVVCAMYKVDCYGSEENLLPIGFTMYPRSSLSKTRLRMANCVGVIDSGYRGSLLGAFDVLGNLNELSDAVPLVDVKQRLVQVCHPGLKPFRVLLVDNITDLGITQRGSGGFGSTGK